MALTDRVNALATRTALELKAVRAELASAGAPRGTIAYAGGPIEAGTVFTSILPEGVASADRQWTLDDADIPGETGETYTATPDASLKRLGCKLLNVVYEADGIDIPEIDLADIVIVGLPIWTSSLNAVRAGERNAKLMVFGDSIPRGYYTGGLNGFGNDEASKNLTALLADKITAETSFFGSNNSLVGNGNIGAVAISDYDHRITDGAGWDNTEVFEDAGMTTGAYNLSVIGATRTPLTITPDHQTDTLELYYPRAPYLAGDGFNVDLVAGGAVTFADAYNATATFQKITITRARGSNVWRLTPVSSDLTFLAGFAVYDSTQKEITLMNASWSGGGIVDHASSANSGLPLVGIDAFDPDLGIIIPSGNDILAGVTEANYKAALNALIDKLQSLNSDALVVLPPPAAPAMGSMTNLRNWSTTVAAAQGVPMIDLFDVFDYEDAVAAGWYAPDGVHVIGAGQAAMCAFIFDRIMP